MTLPEGYSFRRAGNEDSGAVKALIFGVLEEYGLSPEPEHADRGLSDIEASFRNGFLDLVIAPDGRIAGTVGFLIKDMQEGELTKMFLHPAFRGKGLGHAMIGRVLEAAREAGLSRIELETDTALKEAISLYQRYGFVRLEKPNCTERCNTVMALTL